MAKLYYPDGAVEEIELNGKLLDGKELEWFAGKDYILSTPKSSRSSIFAYTEREDDEFNIKASERAGVNLSGVVIEFKKEEANFEF